MLEYLFKNVLFVENTRFVLSQTMFFLLLNIEGGKTD